MKKMIALLALAAVLTLPLAACNTIEGIGRDFETAGKTLQEL
jgi:predicted small secreted protein